MTPKVKSLPSYIKDSNHALEIFRTFNFDLNDLNDKCEEMCQFLKKRGYPDSAVTTGKHCSQAIDRETALKTSQDEETNRMPLIPIMYSQIHVAIFPPMAKLLYTLKTYNTPQFLYSL